MALPSGYTQLEFIQSSGTQCIDTGFRHNQNTRVVMDVLPLAQSANAWLFEGRISSSSAAKGIFYYYSSTKKWSADYNGSSGRYAFSAGETDRLEIDYNKNTCTVNGVSNTWTSTTFQSTANLFLLACNTDGAISGYANAKLYACQIYDNGTLVRNFVPAKRNSDNVVGLYDAVNGAFYTNAGTGTFTAGEAVGPSGHRTMTNGTSFEISGGRVMADGTVYDVKKSRCMVGGTAFDILFRKTQTVNISGSVNSSYGFVTINGTKITNSGTYTYETEETLDILVYVSASSEAGRAGCYVKLNGSVVQRVSGGYEMITEANVININFGTGFNTQSFYYAEITTS